jgi:hypothetical protein
LFIINAVKKITEETLCYGDVVRGEIDLERLVTELFLKRPCLTQSV